MAVTIKLVRLAKTKARLARKRTPIATSKAVRLVSRAPKFPSGTEKREAANQKLIALENVIFNRHAIKFAVRSERGNRAQEPRRQQQTHRRNEKSISTDAPRSDRRNCASNKGSIKSLSNPSSPPKRSRQVTSAHSIPSAAKSQSRTGRPPAGVLTARQTRPGSRAGRTARSQSAIRIPVADVDHGIETATPTASQSASCKSR